MAVIGNKIICGWGCPFGGLQELLFETPLGESVRRLRRKKLPFKITNPIRIIIFAAFVLFVFGMVGGKKGFVVYHYINPLDLFDLDLTLATVAVSVTLFTVLALFMYRSFCQFICPFGVISWVLEKAGLTRVQINGVNCTECTACVQVCPLEAMNGRMEGASWPADSFSCARCLRSCEYDALDYKGVWDRA